MFNLGKELDQDYGNHRAGWAYATSCLRDFHDEKGPDFISFVEKKFVFGSDKGDINNDFEPVIRPWVGVIHCPVNVPLWFNRRYSPEIYFNTSEFQSALKHCKGLISLSSPLSRWLESNCEPSVSTLLHPTEACTAVFKEQVLTSQAPLKVVQLGFWLRKLHGIHQLDLSRGKFQKYMVGASRPNQQRMINIERGIFDPKIQVDQPVKMTGFLSNIDYDDLLSEAVVFVDFYDTSANNAIIECVVRGTPILCPPLGAIVDYLGADYPLYFRSMEEAEFLLSDRVRLLRGVQYLRESGVAERLSLTSFKDRFEHVRFEE